MKRIYVLSDNQYFSLGISYLYGNKSIYMLSPKDIIKKKMALKGEVCYIYIENDISYSRVCQSLRLEDCQLVFFFKVDPAHNKKNTFPMHIYSSKMAVDDFARNFVSSGEYLNNGTKTLSKIRMKHIISASNGLDNYERWVLRRSRSLNPQVIRNHYRTLMASVGLNRISAYNRVFAEKLSQAYAIINGTVSN